MKKAGKARGGAPLIWIPAYLIEEASVRDKRVGSPQARRWQGLRVERERETRQKSHIKACADAVKGKGVYRINSEN